MDESVFWATFKEAGFLASAVVLPVGASEPLAAVDVHYAQPDERMLTGVQSTQHTMEYQATDLPELKEGDQVTIGTSTFRVREAVFNEGLQATGFFKRALLTKFS